MDIKLILKKNYIEREGMVKFLNNYVFTIYDTYHRPWFLANSICKILKYKKPQRKIKEYISSQNKRYFKDFEKHFDKKIINKNERILQLFSTFINKKGIIELLLSCQLPNIDKICKKIGIKTIHRYKRKEIEIIDELNIFLNKIGIKYITQKRINSYKVDIYIPKYKLVIEIDEHNHTGRNKIYEYLREGTIKKWLKCKFIRCNPDKNDFNIHDLTGEITKYLLKI